ncbi:probable ATP-dependent RNA helicase DEAH11, chloroplastic at C-terminar half [Coccomyxa sp. Obi]|nr:probable ATP-dependent RNA helicase DEAH11, chloroplastic at C-terminar half [Coccomyxa sp. Obi]
MANVRAPAVVDLVDDEPTHLDRVTLSKQERPAAQARHRERGALAGPTDARNEDGAVIMLDDSAGSSDEDEVVDLARDRGKAPMRVSRQLKRSRAAAVVDLTGEEDEPETATRAGRWLFAGIQRTDTAYAERHAPSLEDGDVGLQRGGPSRAASGEVMGGFQEAAPSNHGRHRDAGATSEAGPSEAWEDTLAESEQALELAQQGPGAATFSCAVCYDDHPMEDCFIASMCRHRLCRDAAREVVLGAIKSCTFPILCPICQAKADPPCAKCQRRRDDLERSAAAGDVDGGQTNGPASWCCSFDADITLLLSVEEEQEYLARSLKAATNSCADLVPCPQANCEGMAVSGGEDESPELVCNVCSHAWCKSCKVDWHSGLSCDEYLRQVGEVEADNGLKEYQAKNRMISCPTCGHGIEKTDGCNRVQCTGCRTQVCWLCGAKLPSPNPYAHFTANGCPSVGGGAAHNGGGVPAGAWARAPGAPQAATAPAPQPIAAPELAADALVHMRAAQAAAAVAGPPAGAPAQAPPPPAQWDPLPVPRNRRRRRANR